MSEEKKDGEKKVIDKDVITSDPVAFGFVMDFQYGDGKEAEEAEKQLFEEMSDEWKTQPTDFLNLQQLKKIHPDKGTKYLLYFNDGPFSIYTANLLHQIGMEFGMRKLKMGTVNLHMKRVPLPVLVDRVNAGAWEPKEIRGIARWKVLQKAGVERPRIDTGFYSHENYAVTTFDEKGEVSYRGPLANCPIPIAEELERHRYKDWNEVGGWDLGDLDDLLEKRGPHREIVVPKSYFALFFDEVEQLKKDGRLTLEDHMCMYCGRYTSAFTKNNRVYKLDASFID